MDAVLYINTKGQPVTHSSYSARSTFKHCPREFELTRVQGYYLKGYKAATLFGRCIEAALQFFEEQGRKPGAGVQEFVRLWDQVKTLPEFPELEYTDSEGSWEQLHNTGCDMMKIYEIKCVYLPISTQPKTLFQQTQRKKIFPGSHLDAISNKAIYDILTFPRWDHPALDKLAEPTADGLRPLILDCKTTGIDLETELVALDPQLGEYAWQARILDIGFLWFVKKSPGYKRGSRVTILQETNLYRPGFELYVIGDRDDDTAYLGDAAALGRFEEAIKGLRGKAREAAEKAFYSDLTRNGVVLCPQAGFTKQRLQFGAARLTEADLNDVGRKVAQTTVEMVRAHEEQYYPKEPGIRFPNQKCQFCDMRFICLNQTEARDRLLARRGEEWIDEIGEDEN